MSISPVTVRAKNRTEVEILSPATCVMWSNFYITWAVNQTWELHATLIDDSSLAYTLADIESSIFFEGQEYIVKQCVTDYSGGVTTKELTCTHVYNQLAQLRIYNKNEDEKSYSIADVLNFYLNGNKLGFSFEVYGNFPKQSIQGLGDDTGTDMLSKIVSTWSDAVIYPNNRIIRVYKADQFYQDYGKRIDYLRDTSEIKLTKDSTGITNMVRCVGGKYTEEKTVETTTKTAGAGAQKVVSAAKKYLGIPYIWGGNRPIGSSPRSGMDCSSFVAQVYKDLGISVPAYAVTTSLETLGHEISRSQVQAGDMGFYGIRGNSTHVALALDNRTMIYEPRPGQVCMTSSIDSYAPNWWVRNDRMAAIVAEEGEVTTTETETEEKEYFAPFVYRDEASIAKWGEYPATTIEDERFHDVASMTNYAKTQLQPDPILSVDVTQSGNAKPIPGEIRILKIGDLLKTSVKVVGFTWYPWDKATATSITFDNVPINVLNSNNKLVKQLQNFQELAQREINSMRASQESMVKSNAIALSQAEERLSEMQSTMNSLRTVELSRVLSVAESERVSRSESQSFSESMSLSESLSQSITAGKLNTSEEG